MGAVGDRGLVVGFWRLVPLLIGVHRYGVQGQCQITFVADQHVCFSGPQGTSWHYVVKRQFVTLNISPAASPLIQGDEGMHGGILVVCEGMIDPQIT